MKPIRLNLGSGSNRKQDYLSVDMYDPAADLMIDITRRLPWDDNSVDSIYACHVIEHLSRAEWEFCRKDWARVLKPGGDIEILCPNILKVCEKFINDPTDSYAMMQLYGLQSTPGEFHKNGFMVTSLIESFPDFEIHMLPPTDDTEIHMRFVKNV